MSFVLDDKRAYIIDVFLGLNELISHKTLEWCLAHSKHLINVIYHYFFFLFFFFTVSIGQSFMVMQ